MILSRIEMAIPNLEDNITVSLLSIMAEMKSNVSKGWFIDASPIVALAKVSHLDLISVWQVFLS